MDCRAYADWSRDLHRRVVAGRVPISGSIDVTHRCNQACRHCYNNCAADDGEAAGNELSCEEHCRILDEIADAGCLWLLYTGGEIFLREDFPEIYTYAKQKGFLITLFTNGTLITEQITDSLCEWPPFGIEISLYGSRAAIHERTSCSSGSFEQCVDGIHLLRERGLPVTVKTVVSTLNKDDLPRMKRYVEETLGLEFRFDAMINPRIDGSKAPLGLRLPPEEVVEMEVRDERRLSSWHRFIEGLAPHTLDNGHMDTLYRCGAGINDFAIDPYGGLRICAFAQNDVWDLRRGGFLKGWETALADVRDRKTAGRSPCRTCTLQDVCGMCPPNGELENGDPEEPVAFYCETAHLLAEALGLESYAYRNKTLQK